MGYARSLFRDFEKYLTVFVGLHEDDIQLILKQNNEIFVTYELSPGVYTSKDSSEAVHFLGEHERTIKTEYNDKTMKTKFILTRFGSTFGTLRFDIKSFFHTKLGFTQY